MRPISMKCSKEQFDSIIEKLMKHKIKISEIDDFSEYPYLVNTYRNNSPCVSNVSIQGSINYNRTRFEEWDEKFFLENCLKQLNYYPLSMKCSLIQFEEIKPLLIEHGMVIVSDLNFNHNSNYLVNNDQGIFGQINIVDHDFSSDWNRNTFRNWDKDIFLKSITMKYEQKSLLKK